MSFKNWTFAKTASDPEDMVGATFIRHNAFDGELSIGISSSLGTDWYEIPWVLSEIQKVSKGHLKLIQGLQGLHGLKLQSGWPTQQLSAHKGRRIVVTAGAHLRTKEEVYDKMIDDFEKATKAIANKLGARFEFIQDGI